MMNLLKEICLITECFHDVLLVDNPRRRLWTIEHFFQQVLTMSPPCVKIAFVILFFFFFFDQGQIQKLSSPCFPELVYLGFYCLATAALHTHM